MAGKVVSIKIGYSITHVIEVDHEAKNPRVYHAFSFETPEGVLDDEGVHVTELFLEMMRQGMLENGIQNNRVIFAMSSTRVVNREVTLPLVKDVKIRPMLIANSKEHFPVDLSKYQLVYRVIERNKTDKKMKLSVYAVPNTLVDSYQQLAKALNFQLVALDYFGNSIQEAMLHSMSPELAVSICIEDDSSLITVLKEGKVLLQRSIGYGIDSAVEAVLESNLVPSGSTYRNALSAMHANVCFNEQLRTENTQSAKDSITQSLTMLIGNISRVLDYFASRNSELEINEIALIGMGADCHGLDTLLTNELGVPVVRMKKFGSMDITRQLSAKSWHFGQYYTCVGAAISPLNFVLEDAEKKVEETKSLKPALVMLGVCAGVSLILVGVGLTMNLLTKAKNARLQAEIDEKRQVVEVYNEYVKTKVVHDGVVLMDAMTYDKNDLFLSFVDQMEEKMPSDLLVSTLSASSEGITMSATASSKESVAEVIEQFRTFDCVGNIECTGMSETEDDNGVKQVSFDISVTYAMPSDESAQTEAAE